MKLKKKEYKRLEWGQFIPTLQPDGSTVNVKHYPVHKYQELALNSTTRFTAAIAGTGGGKTVIGPLWMMKQIQRVWSEEKRPFLGMIVAPTYKVLDRATAPTLIETFKDTPIEGDFKVSNHLYILPEPYGGRIWMQGADNPGGLEGGQFDAVWIDEGGQVSLRVWDAIQGRTGARRAPVLITTTPYGFNWLYTDFYKRWSQGDKDYYVVQWASDVNPAYSTEEVNRAKRTMTIDKFNQRYKGLFTQSEGLVFPGLADCVVDTTPDEIIMKDGRLYGGIDFGWNDPFCALSALLDEHDILWIWYERYKSHCEIELHAKHLPGFLDRRIKWFCDHNPEFVRKLKRGNISCKIDPAYKALVPGIDAVNARIRTGRLKISSGISNRRMPAIIAESGSYMYKVNENEEFTGDKPDIRCEDHAMDALRYMVCGIDIRRAA